MSLITADFISTPKLLTKIDTSLFARGVHYHLYEKLGSHIINKGLTKGTCFAVWAPNAKEVSVVGEFNGWDTRAHPLEKRKDSSGIWEGFVRRVQKGAMYKYAIKSSVDDSLVYKRDPFSYYCEVPPDRASIVWDLDYEWKDAKWMQERSAKNNLQSPFSIYEIHFGSWHRFSEQNNRYPTYNEMAEGLIRYLCNMGFTHVEFMPLTAHPLYESWGYQTDGYFAPTSRYGTPQDLMSLIDRLHQHGIGVILDWVPSHFPCDSHGLYNFDGTHLYEHEDPRKGFHPEWKSSIFNYGRHEVNDFLVSSVIFWLEKYHADGIRVDGGSSMLYLDYARKEGEWIPNKHGGHENLEAVDFLRRLNDYVKVKYPDVQMIIEEATPWPDVSRPTAKGGLGFDMKWNMGWMHDTLEYLSEPPENRKYHQGKLTFSLWYAFSENYVLSLSHDEVVHGKHSLIGKMPGDDWQKFANLRLLYGYMFGHPGKKLLFMGAEFGQWAEWCEHRGLDWGLLDAPFHKGLQSFMKDLNRIYKTNPSLYEIDFAENGFQWMDHNDWQQSVISFVRTGLNKKEQILIVCNFTPTPRHEYRIGVPQKGRWTQILNSDDSEYGGSGVSNPKQMETEAVPYHGQEQSLSLNLPPLGVIFIKKEQAPLLLKYRSAD